MMKAALAALVQGRDLTVTEAETAMDSIMSGEATAAQIGAFLIALRAKGESWEEVAGCARAMRARALRVNPHVDGLLDTCGTGGDGLGTFNISTTVAFVVAGCGVPVAKHGNRSASSRCGSADVLEALGVRVDLPPELVARCIDETGIGFLFAPNFHPAARHAAGPRKELGFATIFNILGPLANPAGASYQVMGTCREELVPLMARALASVGVSRALVVHGQDGMDEVSLSGPTTVCDIRGSELRASVLTPDDFGLECCSHLELAGGDASDNAAIALKILAGDELGAPRRVVLANAAAALMVAGVAQSGREGVAIAQESIDRGHALAKLSSLRAFTQCCVGEAV